MFLCMGFLTEMSFLTFVEKNSFVMSGTTQPYPGLPSSFKEGV